VLVLQTFVLASVLGTLAGCSGSPVTPQASSSSAPPPPSFSPGPGSYGSAQSVSIVEGDSSAVVHFTTDGSSPSVNSPQYTGPISVSGSKTLQAVAVYGGATSSVATGAYTIALPATNLVFVAQPSDSTAGSPVAPAVTVALVDANGDQVPTANGAVTVALQQNGTSVGLAGTTSIVAGAGLATFSDLIVNTAGSGYTLVASAGGLPNVQSSAFTIVPQLPSQQANVSDGFVDSIGVQTHINYDNTAYGNWNQVLAGLEALGVRHIRDGLPTTNTFVSDFQQLEAAGIHCTCGFSLPNSLTATQINGFVQQAQNVEALESPNECDASTNCGGGGSTGIANVIAFLPILDGASKLTSLPVIGPSFLVQASYASAGNLSSLMNYNNLHIYFGGRNPGSTGWGANDPEGNSYGSFAWWIDQANMDGPNVPDMVTETGYMAYPTTTTAGTIPESVEASYIPRTLLLSYLQGVKRTFIYELLDESAGTGYGLLANDFSEKPAFTSVKNLIATLQDPGSSFNPGSLNYGLSGNTNTLQHLLLEKRDGSYWLVLWLEEPSYNSTNNTPMSVISQNVTLSIGIGSKFGDIIQFDTTGNVASTPLSSSAYTTPLTVSDQLSIVQIVPR
jgi:Chitobiase/beta-hexosaminidase C-terminal domain